MFGTKNSAPNMHLHCETCHPVLQRGVTPAICGEIIPPAIVVSGKVPRQQKCPACSNAKRQHKASHR